MTFTSTVLASLGAALGATAQGSHTLEPGVLPEGDGPVDLEITADGRYALLLHRISENLVWYDLDLRATVGALDVGPGATELELTPDGRLALIASDELDALVVVDLRGRSVIGTVAVGDRPEMVRAAQDSRTVYVADVGEASIAKVDLASLAIVDQSTGAGTLGTTIQYWDLALADDDRKLLAVSFLPDGLRVIDTATMEEELFLGLLEAHVLSVTPDGRHAGLLHGDPMRYSLYATDTMAEIAVVNLPGLGYSNKLLQVLGPNAEYAYVTDDDVGRRLRFADGEKSAFAPVPETWALAIDATGRNLVVGGRGDLAEPNTIRIYERFGMELVAELDTVARPLVLDVSPVAPAAVAVLWRATIGIADDLAHFSTAGADAELLQLAPSGIGVEGDYPTGVAVSPDGTRALVCNTDSHNLGIVDLETRAVLGHIPLGYPPLEVDFAPSGEVALVRAREFDLQALDTVFPVLVVDLATKRVEAVLPFERWVVGVAVTPDSSLAVVLERGGSDFESDGVTFVRLDGPDTRLLTRFESDVIGSGHSVDTHVTPDGEWLFVGSEDQPELAILDLVDMTHRADLPLGDPWGLAPRPGGAELAVSNGEAGIAVLAVDGGGTAPVGASIPLEEVATNLAYSPDGEFLYAAGRLSHSDDWVLARIDADTREIAGQLPLPGPAAGHEALLVSADGTRIKLAVRTTGVSLSEPAVLWNVAVDGAGLALLETETQPANFWSVAGSSQKDLLIYTYAHLEQVGIFTGTR